MKKKVIKRCLFGAPIGLLISHIILLITSIFLSVATKKYEGDFLRKLELFEADCFASHYNIGFIASDRLLYVLDTSYH